MRSANRSSRSPGPFPEVPLRVLALLDAIALPALGLYWVTTWPASGLFGGVVAMLLLWWGFKRGRRALFAFDEYRWTLRHFLRLAVLGVVLQAVMWCLR